MLQIETTVTTTEFIIRGGPPCKVTSKTARSSINNRRGRSKGSQCKTRNGLGNQRTGREPPCGFMNSVDKELNPANLDCLKVAPKSGAGVGRGKYFTGVDALHLALNLVP